MRSASLSSSVNMAPPSPKHPSGFDGKKDVHPMCPAVPEYLRVPSGKKHSEPRDCALSSITVSPCRAAMSLIAAMSHGCPNKCTGTMAFVRGVIMRSALSADMLNVSASTSANTGVPPSRATASATAPNENAGTITSSPCPMPVAIIEMNSASVPLPHVMQCFVSRSPASLLSSSPTASPLIKSELAITSFMALSILPAVSVYWQYRSAILMSVLCMKPIEAYDL